MTQEGATPDPAMRVLMTADAVGGVWTYALDLAAGLSREGIATTLAVLGPKTAVDQRAAAAAIPGLDLVETGLPLDWTAESPADIRRAGVAIAELAREARVDLVHLNSPALAADANFGRPLVALCHSCVATWWAAVRGTSLPPDFAWRAELVARGYRAADALIAPSRAFANATATAYGIAPPEVVYNGRANLAGASEPGAGPLSPRERNRARGVPSPGSVRPSPGRPDRGDSTSPHGRGGSVEAPVAAVFTAGRLWDEGKNIARLDRAAARLGAPVRAAGASRGPNGADLRFERIEDLGRLAPEGVAAHLARRPIFCSPALYEPFGLAVLEAAEAGCALVLSDIPSFRELWQDSALFVCPTDEGALAQALQRLLDDPAERRRLGAAARVRARLYTADAMVEGTLAIYERLLAGARSPVRPERRETRSGGLHLEHGA